MRPAIVVAAFFTLCLVFFGIEAVNAEDDCHLANPGNHTTYCTCPNDTCSGSQVVVEDYECQGGCEQQGAECLQSGDPVHMLYSTTTQCKTVDCPTLPKDCPLFPPPGYMFFTDIDGCICEGC